VFKLNNGKYINDIYFIAELNTSHFGDIKLAKKMIIEASRIGVDCVKFQSWNTNSLYSKTYYEKNPIAKRFVKKYSLSEDQLYELSCFCLDHKIDFLSTPYSVPEVNFLLDECNSQAIKISSMEINNLDFIKYIAETGSSIFLSTGMADFVEIQNAVQTILNCGNENLCLFHCVSQYPTELYDANIQNIRMFEDKFPNILIGYSDHTLGYEASSCAVALGAKVIERHFTLDKSKIGMDNQMASEPEEFQKLIKQCYSTKTALGSYKRILTEKEIEQRKNMRRSIVYKSNLYRGDILQKENLTTKRPGTSIPPTQLDKLIGKKLIKNVSEDSLVYLNHLEEN
jgi:sialic acid synthase SpsE